MGLIQRVQAIGAKDLARWQQDPDYNPVRVTPAPVSAGPFWWLAGRDPLGSGLHFRQSNRRQLIVGLDGNTYKLLLAVPDSSVLALGPSGKGKTAGLFVWNVLFHPAPALVVSSRSDVFQATSLARSRIGLVQTLMDKRPGAMETRFSLSQGCHDFSEATEVARRWLSYETVASGIRSMMKGDRHWPELANPVLAVGLYVASKRRWSMKQMSAMFKNYEDKDWAELASDLNREGSEDSTSAATEIKVMVNKWRGERSGLMSAITKSLVPFVGKNALALEASEHGDFDFDSFVRIRDQHSQVRYPDGDDYSLLLGRSDTVYVNVGDAEALHMTYIMEFIHRVIDAAKRYADDCERDGRPRPHPVLIALDELAASPIPELPGILAHARNRGVLILGGIQSLGQAKDLYAQADFPSLWRNLSITPGVVDEETLKLMSMIAGKFWRQMTSFSPANGPKETSQWNPTISHQEMDVLRFQDIIRGHPYWPDSQLNLNSDAQLSWVVVPPYYRDVPLPAVLVNSAEWSLLVGESDLPLPDLARDGDYSYLESLGLAQRFRNLKR